ncbi:MAG: hypothetical protein QXP60_07995 [Nitrososphaerota archaeon]
MNEEEKIKALAEIKKYLEEKLIELNKEIDMIKIILGIVNEQLVAKSFKQIEIPKTQLPKEAEELREIRSRKGELLGTIQITSNMIRITPSPEIELSQENRPFKSFFIKKVLDGMIQKDKKLIDSGQLQPGMEISYDILQEGEYIREIIIKNYSSETRLKEIINAIRWALETALLSKK